MGGNELFYIVDGVFVNFVDFFILGDVVSVIILKDVMVVFIYGVWVVGGVIVYIIKKGKRI